MRFLGLIDDPIVTGSDYDTLKAATGGPKVLDPTLFVPVTTATMGAGTTNLDRNDEVRGRRAGTTPNEFMTAPTMSFEARAYPKLMKKVLKHAMGGAVTTTGTAPAAITSQLTMADYGQPSTLMATMVRDGQQERMSGVALGTVALNLPLDNHGTISVSDAQGLYHCEPGVGGVPAAALPTPVYPGFEQTAKLRDVKLFYGSTPENLVVTSMSLSMANNLVDDAETRYVHGRNIETLLYQGVQRRLWHPSYMKRGAQAITGSLGLREASPEWELRRKLAHADKLVIEIDCGPITPATTPPANEVIRITLGKVVLTGGDGAGALVRDGDIRSSYDFTVYADETTGQDMTVEFVSSAAVS